MSRIEIFYNTSRSVGDDIKSGRPCSIIHFDPKSYKVTHEENHNMENIEIPKHALESLARALLPDIQEFYQTEEGKKVAEQIEREQAVTVVRRKQKKK